MLYQQLINGLMLGASYSLVAIGYTLIFGVLNLLYFAHGEVFMVGAFVGLFLVLYAGTGKSSNSGSMLMPWNAAASCSRLAASARIVCASTDIT